MERTLDPPYALFFYVSTTRKPNLPKKQKESATNDRAALDIRATRLAGRGNAGLELGQIRPSQRFEPLLQLCGHLLHWLLGLGLKASSRLQGFYSA